MTRKKQHRIQTDTTALAATPKKGPALQKDAIGTLLSDVHDLIHAARGHAASAVNVERVRLYWHIGERIRGDVLGDERGIYGDQIVATLSQQLKKVTTERKLVIL